MEFRFVKKIKMKYFILLFSLCCFPQQFKQVDFTTVTADLSLNVKNKSISGQIMYQFNISSTIDSIRIDAKNMEFNSVFINQKEVRFKNSKKELILYEGFKLGKNILQFNYLATPKQTLYFTGSQETNNLQIWTQGQGRYTSHWFPSFDDVNEKVIFDIKIAFDASYQVISNGEFRNIKNSNNLKIWQYEMKKPMSSYLLMLAIGKFKHKNQKAKSGILLQNYYRSEDELKYEYTFKNSKDIFDFLETEIGVKYPWKVYRQIPVNDFLYAGMENTTSTLFDQSFVVDESAFNDRNYINVNAHELAHQWFGDLITAKSGKQHWLQESFATYYALLAERKVFGEDYYYYKLYTDAMQVKQAAKTDTIPVMNEKASSLSFYQKGSLGLHTIREAIGAKKFQQAIKNYLNKFQFKNVETDDFLNEIKKVSNFDTEKFKKNWLEDYHFQTQEIADLLNKNEFIKKLLEIQGKRSIAFAEKELYFAEILKSNCFYPLKTEIIYQIKNVPYEVKENLIKLAMQTNDIEVRQAVAQTISKIPPVFKTDYESLLNDISYDTKEIALTNLISNFPDEISHYLEIAENWEGKNDKSLRILFLTYSQVNKSISDDLKVTYLNELIDYTSPKFDSAIRQNAFESLFQLDSKNEIMLKNLVNATFHHKWQFVKFAKDKVRGLNKIEAYKMIFENLKSQLSAIEKTQLIQLTK